MIHYCNIVSYRGLISLSHSHAQFVHVLFNPESVPLIGPLCCADSADLVKTSLLIVHVASCVLAIGLQYYFVVIRLAVIIAGLALVALLLVLNSYDCCGWNTKWTHLLCISKQIHLSLIYHG